MREYLTDLKVVLRPLWLFLLLEGIVVVAFLLAPQGPDVLFGIIENYSGLFRPAVPGRFIRIAPFFCMGVAIAYWSLASEFCSRILLHISDLSSRRIGADRVQRRRNMVRYIPMLLYHFPASLVFIAFVVSFVSHREAEDEWHVLSFLFILASLLALLWFLYHLRYGWLSRRLFYRRVSIARIREVIRSLGFWYHGYFRWLVLLSLVLLLFCAFAPPAFYEALGSTTFICLGFGVWTVVYALIEILYHIRPLPLRLPYKTLLLLWLVLCSRINADHPARTIARSGDARPALEAHFRSWNSGRQPAADTVPVVFVAAEGGALRTGCFTSMMLAVLQDSFPQLQRHVYAYSGVSGGSVGVGLFYQLGRCLGDTGGYAPRVKEFYRNDFLAPVTGKLVFGEPFNWISPWPLAAGDRAIALEQSWEGAWDRCMEDRSADKGRFGQRWSTLNSSGPGQAALFINTTEAETGLRGIISSVRFPEPWFFQSKDVAGRMQDDMPYSTALAVSARFPLITPGAAIRDGKDDRLYHYVDGGYYENKGAATLYEVIRYCQGQMLPGKVLKPIVLQLAFDTEPGEEPRPIRLFNEVREPLSGILNVRNSHTRYASEVLRQYVASQKGLYVSFSVGYTAHTVPVNWTLSGYALEKIETRCKNLLRNTGKDPAMDELYRVLGSLR